jgi:hypothetical protein
MAAGACAARNARGAAHQQVRGKALSEAGQSHMHPRFDSLTLTPAGSTFGRSISAALRQTPLSYSLGDPAIAEG